ncbi:MAG: hypothetical protein ACM358_13015 [Gemmatimonadota bacterium]
MDEPRTPESGETLILSDGRRFRVSRAEAGVRGWWFTASAQDGSCVLQGNLALEWDPRARVWRPKGTLPSDVSDIALPPSMRSAPSAKRKQLD